MATATNMPGAQPSRSPNNTSPSSHDDTLNKIREPFHDALESLDQKRQAAQRDLADFGGKVADKVSETVKRNPLSLVLAGAGVLVVVGGVTGLLIRRARQRNRPIGWLRSLF